MSGAEVDAILAALRRAGVLVAAHAVHPPGPLRHLPGEIAALVSRPPRPDRPRRTPAQTLRRRAAARVLVSGDSRLAAPIAVALAAAGVGHVGTDVCGPVTGDDLAPGGLTRADLGRAAAAAVRALVAAAAPGVTTAALRPEQADLLVQVGTRTVPAPRRPPHLAVAVRDGTLVVGPFVPAAGAPCLTCLDLHRRDRDPAWADLRAQLATTTPPAPLCAVATMLIGVGYAVADALAHLDGDVPRTRGLTIELDADGEKRRRWTDHPRCDCARGRRTRSATGKN